MICPRRLITNLDGIYQRGAGFVACGDAAAARLSSAGLRGSPRRRRGLTTVGERKRNAPHLGDCNEQGV